MDSKNRRNSGKNESTTSLNSSENGSIDSQDATEVRCAVCGKPNAKKCTRCKEVAYCNKDCQRKHWPVHKSDCKSNQQRHKDEHSCNSTRPKQTDKQSDISNESKTNDNECLSSDKDKQATGLEQNEIHEGEQNIENLSTKSAQANDSEGITNGKENQFGGVEAQPSNTESQTMSTSNSFDQNQEAEGDNAEKGDVEPQIDIQDILNDTAIRNAFMDPTIDKAIREIKQDPLNIGNYKENEKLKDLIELVTQKRTSKTNGAQ